MINDKSVVSNSALKPSILRFKMADESIEGISQQDYSFKGEEDQQRNQQTPTKSESLKEAILNRVSASRKSKQTRRQLKQVVDQFTVYENLKELIINNQSSKSDGYYSYTDWLHINEVLFEGANELCVRELWKILRIVNFGQVSIPTGLIYEVLAIFKSVIPVADKEQQLVSTINHFLTVNQMKSNFYSLRELNNYKPLLFIIENYTSKEQNNIDNQFQTSRKSNRKVFEELFQDAKTRSQKKTFNCILNSKDQLKQCTFIPFVTHYPGLDKSQIYNSHHKRCAVSSRKYRKQDQSWLSSAQKANPVNPRIFDTPVSSIWGAQEHIRRTTDSYKEKLRVKRMIQKPVVVKHFH